MAHHSNSQEFADFLSSHGVRHTTSSPHYPQSNGFIKCQIQTVKNLLYKAVDADTRSFQEVLSELRSTKIGKDLPSPAEILHGRCLVTGSPVQVGPCRCQDSPGEQADQGQPTLQQEPQSPRTQRPLVLGERCWATGTNNEWSDCYITGIDEKKQVPTGCYLRALAVTLDIQGPTSDPEEPNIPHISEKYLQESAVFETKTSVLSGGKGENRANQAEKLGPFRTTTTFRKRYCCRFHSRCITIGDISWEPCNTDQIHSTEAMWHTTGT